jgi:hypothetical protein
MSRNTIILLEICVRFPAWEKKFLFCTASRPAAGPTQPRTQLVRGGGGGFTEGNAAEATQTTHLHLVPRLRMVVLYLRSPIRRRFIN